jgi:hypothetical protein
MTESIYAWMQKTVPPSGPTAIKKSENPKNTDYMDLNDFIGTKKQPQSNIFDEGFNQDDFRLLTRRWKEKNLVMN